MLERIGQRLGVTNVANGKSVSCTVVDKGPSRKFWPRREIDLTPPASKAIGCDGMCDVNLERVAQ
jgi:rare lipoprotein A (peptidoglycan hydrolase)